MIEVPVVQGSPEWFSIRRGRPRASEAGRIVTPVKWGYAAGATTYQDELLAERLGAVISDFQGTPDTERGTYFEKEALRWLKFRHGIETRDVGFCLSDDHSHGASPDAMAGADPVEVKCPRLTTFLGWLREYEESGTLPSQHKAQVHGEMWVTGANRCIFVAYANSEHIDNLMIEVRRDDDTEKMGDHIGKFCEELENLAERRLEDEYDVLTADRQRITTEIINATKQ